MSAHLFRKTLGALRPVDDGGQEIMSKIRDDEIVRVEVKRARNPRHLAKLWVLLKLVADNSPGFVDAEHVLDNLKIAVGHFDMRPGPHGSYPKVRSISYAALDQSAFEAVYDRFLDVIVEKWLPHVSVDDLRSEVELLCGIRSEPDRPRKPAVRRAA